MIKLFHIPPGDRDITRSLFEEALKGSHRPDYSDILYLAPTPAKVREARSIFHGLVDDKCYVPPEMATIGQLSKNFYSACGDKRILRRALVPVVLSALADRGIGFSSVEADFIRDIKRHFPEDGIGEIRERFERVFFELNIPESAAKAVNEGLETFERYRSFMRDNGLVDENDVLNILGDSLPDARCPSLILDGFCDPSPAERRVLGRLIGNAEKTLASVYSGDKFREVVKGYTAFLKENHVFEEIFRRAGAEAGPEAYVYYACSDIEEEVEGIVRDIKSLFVSGKFRNLERITVAFPELGKYSAMIERIFRRYGVPCDVSARKPLGSMRPFLDLMSLLAAVAGDYPRLPFSTFLASGYFSRVPASLRKWVPSLSVQSGIVSGKDSWMAFMSQGSELVDLEDIKVTAPIDKELGRIFRLLLPLERMKAKGGFREYAETLRGLLDDLGFLNPPADSLTRKLLRATAELLEQMTYLGALYGSDITLSRFTEVFGHLLNSACLDTEGNGVQVVPFQETAGLHPDYLYMGGLTDSAMPGRPGIDYILPDSVKKRLGMPDLGRHMDIQEFIFRVAAGSGGNIQLSCSLMDGDNVFIPSSFLYPAEQAVKKLPGIYSEQERLVAAGRTPYSDIMKEIRTAAPAAYAEGRTMRVTDVDSYRTCPRRFFIEKALGIRPLGIKEYELEAATLGTIIHRIMEHLIREPLGDIESLRERAVATAGEVMSGKNIYPYWKRLVTDSFLGILPEIFEKEVELRKGGYLSTEVEKNVTGEPVKGIKLSGKIDRYDRMQDGIRIMDYKTGTAGLTCSQAAKGNENLQLFLYAAIMKNHGYRVNQVGIYSLKDVEIKWCPPKRKGKGRGKGGGEREQCMDDYIIASLKFLESSVGNLREGDFQARPINDYICRNCHENPFCPYINS